MIGEIKMMKPKELKRMEELQREIKDIERKINIYNKSPFMMNEYELEKVLDYKEEINVLKKELSPLEFNYKWMEQEVMYRVNEETKLIKELDKREHTRKEYERLKIERKNKSRDETITLNDLLG